MKNIFKLMGIAVLACGMMVACNKDNNDPNDTTPDNPQPTTPTAKVTFGNTNWDATVASCNSGNMAQYNVEQFMLMKEQGAYPMVNLMISGVPGTFSGESTVGEVGPGEDENYPDGYNYYQWQGGYELYKVDYFESQAVQTPQGYAGDWTAKTANLTVTSFDLNTLTATFNLTATMYAYASWYYGDVLNATDADEKNMTVAVSKYQFTEMQGK